VVVSGGRGGGGSVCGRGGRGGGDGGGGGGSWAWFDLERMFKKNRLITQSLITDFQQPSTATTTVTYYSGSFGLVITGDFRDRLDDCNIIKIIIKMYCPDMITSMPHRGDYKNNQTIPPIANNFE